MTTARDLLSSYITTRRLYEESDRIAKRHYAELKSAEARLAEAMIEEGSLGIRDGDVEYRTKPFRSFYVNEATNDAWAAWLEKRGEVVEDYSEWKVSKRKASDYARKVIEKEGEAALPPEFSKVWDGITASGWKGE